MRHATFALVDGGAQHQAVPPEALHSDYHTDEDQSEKRWNCLVFQALLGDLPPAPQGVRAGYRARCCHRPRRGFEDRMMRRTRHTPKAAAVALGCLMEAEFDRVAEATLADLRGTVRSPPLWRQR